MYKIYGSEIELNLDKDLKVEKIKYDNNKQEYLNGFEEVVEQEFEDIDEIDFEYILSRPTLAKLTINNKSTYMFYEDYEEYIDNYIDEFYSYLENAKLIYFDLAEEVNDEEYNEEDDYKEEDW